MTRLTCSCGTQVTVPDHLAGRPCPCPGCGQTIGQRTAGRPAVRGSDSRSCTQCGAPIPNLTYVCAFCGTPVASRRAAAAANGGVGVLTVPQAPAQPQGILEGMLGLRVREEARAVPDSPEELITFFSKHIGGVALNRHSEVHTQACEGALTKLWAFSRNDPALRRVTAELQAKFENAKATQKRMVFGILASSVLFFVGLMSVAGYMAINQNNRHAAARDEVQALIRQGRYDEARVRAQGLEFKSEIDQMLQAIDQAERKRKPR